MFSPNGTSKLATPATTRMATRQKAHPPLYPLNNLGFDRAQALCGVLYPHLPQALQRMLDGGTVVVGEVGEYRPSADTFQEKDKNFVIEINSGLMDFYYAVGRALAGITVVRSTSPLPENAMALPMGGVVERVLKVYREWQAANASGDWSNWFHLDRLFRKEQRIAADPFAVAEVARRTSEMLVTTAELFIIAHELAHVAIDSGLKAPPTDNDELNADTHGFQFYFQAAQDKVGARMAFAAVGFAFRVTEGLERIGFKFGANYPPSADRLANIQQMVAGACASPQYFHEVSTVMVSYQDVMDAVDNGIKTGSAPARPEDERVSIRMIAELEDLAHGVLTPETFMADIGKLTSTHDPASMKAICEPLYRYYVASPPQEAYLPPDIRAKMGEELTKIIVLVPAPLRAVFPA
jgi:hypothetical protein